METLVAGTLFALYLGAQVLAVIVVSGGRTPERSRQPAPGPDGHRTRLIWQSET